MSAPLIVSWVGQNAVELRNSTIARQFSLITGSWTQLRVGILVSITTGSNTNVVGTPRFALGICSGIDNVFGDQQCKHFLGFRTNTATFTYTSASVGNGVYYSYPAGQYIRRSPGPTDAVTGDPIATAFFTCPYYSASLVKGISCNFVDFVRPSGSSGQYNMVVTFYYANIAGPTQGLENLNTFLKAMQETAVSSIVNTVAASALNVPINEDMSGSFDAVNVSWDREPPDSAMVIYAVAVSVIA